jgi:hypothetical protein
MATDVERWCFIGKPHGVGKGVAVRHQRGRSNDPMPVSMNDPCVYISSKSEIIGVDD